MWKDDSMYYDKSGKPLELMEWARLHQDKEYCRIDWTELPNGLGISTVWLGLDYNFFPGGRLHIFETALLKDGMFQNVIERCDTLENAKEMHRRAVQEYGGQ